MLERLFLSAFNKLISERDEISTNFELIKETLLGTMALETEQVEVQREIEVMTGLVVKCVRSSANMALDQDEYQKRYSALRALQIGQEPTRAVTAQIAGNTTAGKKIEQFFADLMKQPALVTEFDPVAWHTMADAVTVYSREDVQFTFMGGIAFRF